VSNTRIEKEAYRYLKGYTDKAPISVLKKWDRHNFDLGYYRFKKKQITEKIFRNDRLE